jgi:hypothetical protein
MTWRKGGGRILLILSDSIHACQIELLIASRLSDVGQAWGIGLTGRMGRPTHLVMSRSASAVIDRNQSVFCTGTSRKRHISFVAHELFTKSVGGLSKVPSNINVPSRGLVAQPKTAFTSLV